MSTSASVTFQHISRLRDTFSSFSDWILRLLLNNRQFTTEITFIFYLGKRTTLLRLGHLWSLSLVSVVNVSTYLSPVNYTRNSFQNICDLKPIFF